MTLRGLVLPRDKVFWILALLLGIIAFSVPFGLVYWGQQHIPTGLASILFATHPLCVAVLSYFFLPFEQMNPAKWMGTFAGFAGIYVIFASDFTFQSELVVWGMAAVVFSAILQAFSVVAAKKYARPFSSMSLNFVGMTVGGLLLGLISLTGENYSRVSFGTEAILSIFYLAVFGSMVTFVTYFWLLKQIQAVLLSLTAFITPILTVIVGAIVLHERLPAQILAGSSLVLAGILMANARDLVALVRRGKAFLFDR